MIALDTNLLVHAHRRDAAFHADAARCVRELSQAGAPWAIPLHCLVEVYGIVTHPGVWKVPSTPAQAVDQLRAWRESPTLTILADDAEEPALEALLSLVARARVVGPKVHDARIAWTCLQHRVRELWTIDRDFSRFPDLTTRNPIAAS